MASNKMERFTQRARRVLSLAQEEAEDLQHQQIGPEHLLLGLIREEGGVAGRVLRELGLQEQRIRDLVKQLNKTKRSATSQLDLSAETKQVLDLTVDEARRLGHHYIGTEHLILGLMRQQQSMAVDILTRLKIKPEDVRRHTRRILQEDPGSKREDPTRASSSGLQRSQTPLVDQLTTDLTMLAMEGRFDPVTVRATEVETIIQCLCRLTRHNPLVIGQRGVGKTTVIEGVVQAIVNGETPPILRSKRVLQLNTSQLVVGAMYRGQVEERVKRIIEELKASDSIIYFENIQQLLTTSNDATNILVSALAQDEITCIGELLVEQYHELRDQHEALLTSFQPIWIAEPTLEQAIEMMHSRCYEYEGHHEVEISDEAIETAVQVAALYMPDRFLPEKALDLLDQTATRVRMYSSPDSLVYRRVRLEVEALSDELQTELAEASTVESQPTPQVELLQSRLQQAQEHLDTISMNWNPETNRPRVMGSDIIEALSFISHIPAHEVTEGLNKMLADIEAGRDWRPTPTPSAPSAAPDAGDDDTLAATGLRFGRRFNDLYEFREVIGQGAFGLILKVLNRRLNRVEAVKVLPPELFARKKYRDMLGREAQITARLQHPNIVTLYHSFEDEGRQFMAMEYVRGHDLGRLLDERHHLPVVMVRDIAIQICNALEFAHSEGIIHRDIKPGNLLWDGRTVKVADFGISTVMLQTMSAMTGLRAGTPIYLAPEQIYGTRRPDIRTDIYALGVTLYELLTGEPPFAGAAIEHQILNETPLPPSQHQWDVPRSVDEIIMRCLAKDPTERYQNVTEVRVAWENLPEPVSVTPLANLMRAKQQSGESPYILVLGEEASLSSGCASTLQVADAVVRGIVRQYDTARSWHEKLDLFFNYLESLSSSERHAALKPHYQGLEPSVGYRNLAKLIQDGYFNVVLTTNFDVMLEEALRLNNVATSNYQVLTVTPEDPTSVDRIRRQLNQPTPRIKIVKLYGDINTRDIAYLPQQRFAISDALKPLLEDHMYQDLITVGLSLRDEDIARSITGQGGSLWFVHPKRPLSESSISRNPRLSKATNVIWGDNGYFDLFFSLLASELV